jgi:hypothetical protein
MLAEIDHACDQWVRSKGGTGIDGVEFQGGVFVTSLFFLGFWVIAKLSAFLDQ